MSEIATRRARTEDFLPIRTAARAWWGERDLSVLVQRFLLEHFSSTSLVAQEGETMVGFLIGFVSGDDPNVGYVHLIGVDPAVRERGVGTRLYERFTALVQARGVTELRGVTSPGNTGSIAFHRRIGFDLVPSPDGSEVHEEYAGPGQPRVLLRKRLSTPD